MSWPQATASQFSDTLLAAMRLAAQAEHRSVEEVLEDAVNNYLDDRSWAKLDSYGRERAKALGIQESDVESIVSEYRSEKRQR